MDGSGSLSTLELLEYMEEAQSPITDALFSLIDVNGDGDVDFDEFVAVLMTCARRAVAPRRRAVAG